MAVDDDVYRDFQDAVNMTASELEKWLQTEESKQSGQHKDGHESTGHRSGRRIVAILGKHKGDLTTEDEDHMRTVIGFIHRHLEQRPKGDVSETTWRYSLMNWGHDPLK